MEQGGEAGVMRPEGCEGSACPDPRSRSYTPGQHPGTAVVREDDSARDGGTEGGKGPISQPAAGSGATHGGPHATEVDVVAGDQAQLGIHGTN